MHALSEANKNLVAQNLNLQTKLKETATDLASLRKEHDHSTRRVKKLKTKLYSQSAHLNAKLNFVTEKLVSVNQSRAVIQADETASALTQTAEATPQLVVPALK
jgi:predicted  nucleic acid-binding Zn-ribbon protein